ncbi:MAG: ComF family protein [Candidatus Puniceispirillum sp.]
MVRSLGWAARAGLDNLLPPRYPLCGRYSLDTGLCAACWRGLVLINDPMCHRCGRPLAYAGPSDLCAVCLTTPPPLALIRALSVYNDISQQLILQFKHGDGLHITPLLLRPMAPMLAGLASRDTLVVPIPLHRARYLKRRYNQAGELARALIRARPVSADDGPIFAPNIITRPRPGRSQAGLSRQQRIRNLAGAFHVPPVECARLAGRPVLLIDDVMTTGATLYAAARCLGRAGSGPVRALVVARVM